jgi:hypothetical protein
MLKFRAFLKIENCRRITMKIVRMIVICALGFLSATAIVGAVPLIIYPHGQPWQMSQSYLAHSPFHSYLIPGIVLLLANGVLSLFAMYETVRRRSGYAWWVAIQGCVLAGWIVVEVIILREIIWPHYFYLAFGLVLTALGLALTREARG